MKKKICIIRQGYFPNDPRVYKQAKAHSEDNKHVFLICMGKENEKKYEKNDNINIYRYIQRNKRGNKINYILKYLSFFIFAFFMVTKLHIKYKFSSIQVNTMPDFLAFSTLVPKLLGVPIVVDFHELMPELYKSKYGDKGIYNKVIVNLLEMIERSVFKYANRIITVSKPVQNAFTNRGAPIEKFSVILNSPEQSLFKKNKQNIKKSEQLFTIICHGTIVERYGFDTLLNAFKGLDQDKMKLIIIGEGEYKKELYKIADYQNCKNIEFTGHINFEKIPKIIEKANLGIVPLKDDSFTNLMLPNKLFEYIALDIPVVSSRLKTINEYFTDQEVLFFESENEVDLRNKINYLYKNPQQVKDLVKNANKKFSDLSWDTQKKHYLKVFE